MLITSVQNEHVKELAKLKEKKYRDSSECFLVETKHLVIEAYKAGLIQELILETNEIFPLDVPTIYVSKEVIKKISSVTTPSNVMALVSKRKEPKEIGEKVLILDHLQDPGNLGTIIRSAVAFNIDTIVLSIDTVDLYNDKVIRSSEGMIFNINIIKRDLNSFIKELKNNDYEIIGTNVSKGNDINNINLNNKFAILMGNEGTGLKVELQELCDVFLYIKMNELCESLNVGVATSIILYEIAKRG